MLRDIKPRTYQEKIFASAVKRDTLVVLPTGMGKTLIALLMAAYRLKNYPNSKILILAPTKPLAEQHLKSFQKNLEIESDKVVLFTGMIKPDKRAELWKDAKIVISTPQGIENDVITRRINLSDVSLLVVDEAHRAVKDYSYVFISKQYHKLAKHSHILALTASPGSDMEQIEEVCKNLHIEGIEIRTEEDEDVKQYVQDVDTNWVVVDFPKEFNNIKKIYERIFKRKLLQIKEYGYLEGAPSNYTKTALLGLQGALRSKIAEGEKDFDILKSISILAEVMKLQHAQELLESQGLQSLSAYLDKLDEQVKASSSKAVKNLCEDYEFRESRNLLNSLLEKEIEHPKLHKLEEILLNKDIKNKKIIIFTQYRSSATQISKLLSKNDISNKIFVGQASKGGSGLSQKKQKEMIEDFSNNNFSCLISTSVGEEGLDIPQVDLVIFYEPIPSSIRSIQRRGRTGRLEKGQVIILVTKGTRDEAYRWSSHHKEKRMYRNLEKLRNKIMSHNKTLNEYNEENSLTIVADHREKGSGVIKLLVESGVTVDLKSLDVGDYLLSDDVVVEFKTKKDFVDSIIDGRLLDQLKSLTKYLKPILLIEGDEDLYSQRNIHPNAIRGMISTITISYRIPIIYSKNPQDTSQILQVIAKRLQDPNKKEFQMHTSKPTTKKEQQEFIVSSLPNIGRTLSKPLLEKFGSVKKVMLASEEKLKKVDLIGEKKAKKIRDIIDSDY